MYIISMKHYLYRHIRLDKNEPFYIGIGTKSKEYSSLKKEYHRAYSKSKRNYIWEKITNKTPYEVQILFESDNYDFVKDKEKEFINLYGRMDLKNGILSNLTDGGDGSVGAVSNNKKKVYQYDLQGTFLKEYESLTEASQHGDFRNISYCALGNRKTAYGFYWKYEKIDKIEIEEKKPKKTCVKKGLFTKKIYQYDFEGNLIKEYDSIISAVNIYGKCIKFCLYKRIKTAYGFYWSYLKENKKTKFNNGKFKGKSLFRYDIDGNLVKEYKDLLSTSKELNIPRTRIYKVLNKNILYLDSIWKNNKI